MSKSNTFNRADYTMSNGQLRAYSDVGGYPIFYLCADGGVLCAKCASQGDVDYTDPDDKQWYIIAADANWENPSMYCDHCNERIESAYADDDAESADAAESSDGEGEPEDGDWTTEDHRRYYSYGKLVLEVSEDVVCNDKALWRAIRAKMTAEGFFPSVWFISDHGNAHLMKPEK